MIFLPLSEILGGFGKHSGLVQTGLRSNPSSYDRNKALNLEQQVPIFQEILQCQNKKYHSIHNHKIPQFLWCFLKLILILCSSRWHALSHFARHSTSSAVVSSPKMNELTPSPSEEPKRPGAISHSTLFYTGWKKSNTFSISFST